MLLLALYHADGPRNIGMELSFTIPFGLFLQLPSGLLSLSHSHVAGTSIVAERGAEVTVVP
jgi:hypothetical protein